VQVFSKCAGLILFSNAQAPDISGDLRRGGRYLFSGAYGNNSFHEASPKLVSKSQEKYLFAGSRNEVPITAATTARRYSFSCSCHLLLTA
jgi:hypothetical protein